MIRHDEIFMFSKTPLPLTRNTFFRTCLYNNFGFSWLVWFEIWSLYLNRNSFRILSLKWHCKHITNAFIQIFFGVWQLHQYVPLESQKERITQRCHFPIVMLSESLTTLTKDGEQRQSLVKTKCSLKDGCSDTEKHIVEIMVSYKHWTQETKSPWLTYIAFHVTKYITQWCQPIWNDYELTILG